MIDSLIQNIDKIKSSKQFEKMELKEKEYLVITVHRPSNVDNKEKLTLLLITIKEIQNKVKIIFPMHPRTKKNIDKFGLTELVNDMANVRITGPLNYIDFLALVMRSKCVLTDSGGIQEETTYFKVPCITLRENTERPSTTIIGSNVIVGTDNDKILEEFEKIMDGKMRDSQIPPLWDGKTAKRIVNLLIEGNKE